MKMSSKLFRENVLPSGPPPRGRGAREKVVRQDSWALVWKMTTVAARGRKVDFGGRETAAPA